MRTWTTAALLLLGTLAPLLAEGGEKTYATYIGPFNDDLVLVIDGLQTIKEVSPEAQADNFKRLFDLQIRPGDLLELTFNEQGQVLTFRRVSDTSGTGSQNPTDVNPDGNPLSDEVAAALKSLRLQDRVLINGVQGVVVHIGPEELWVKILKDEAPFRTFLIEEISSLLRIDVPLPPVPSVAGTYNLDSLAARGLQVNDKVMVNDHLATITAADSAYLTVHFEDSALNVDARIEWEMVHALDKPSAELIATTRPSDTLPESGEPSQVLEVLADNLELDYENNTWRLAGRVRFEPGANQFVAVGARVTLKLSGTGSLLSPEEEREAVTSEPQLQRYRVWEDGEGGLVLAWNLEDVPAEGDAIVSIPLEILLPGDVVTWEADASETKLAELQIVDKSVILAEKDSSGNGKWRPRDLEAGRAIVNLLRRHASMPRQRVILALRTLLACEYPVGIETFVSFLDRSSEEDEEIVSICLEGLERIARRQPSEGEGAVGEILGEKSQVVEPIYRLLSDTDPIFRFPELTEQGMVWKLTAHPTLVRKRLWQLLANIDPAKGRLLGLEILAGLHPRTYPLEAFRTTILSYFEADEFRSTKFCAFRTEGYRVGEAATAVLDHLGARSEGALRELFAKFNSDEVQPVPAGAEPEEVVRILREALVKTLRDRATAVLLQPTVAHARTQLSSGSLEDAVSVFRDACSLSGGSKDARNGLAEALVLLAEKRVESRRLEAFELLEEARELGNTGADELYGQLLYLVATEMDMGVWVHSEPGLAGLAATRVLRDIRTFDVVKTDFPEPHIAGWVPVWVGADSLGWLAEECVSRVPEVAGVGIKRDSFLPPTIEASFNAVLQTKSSFARLAAVRRAALISAKGEQLFIDGNWSEASDVFEQALAQHEGDPVALYYQKFCLLKQYVGFIPLIGAVLATIIAMSYFSIRRRGIQKHGGRRPDVVSADMPFSELHAGRWLTGEHTKGGSPRIRGDGGFNISGPLPGAAGQSGSLGISKPLAMDVSDRQPDYGSSGPVGAEEESWAQSSGYGDSDGYGQGSSWSGAAGEDTGSGPSSWGASSGSASDGWQSSGAGTQSDWDESGGSAASQQSWNESSAFGTSEGAAASGSWGETSGKAASAPEGDAWTEGGTFGKRDGGGKAADPYDSGGQEEEETGPLPSSAEQSAIEHDVITGPSDAFAQAAGEASGGVTNAVLLDRYEQLQERRNSFPDDPEVFVQLGQVCEDLLRLDEAIKYYTTAAELDPNDPYPRQQLERLLPDGSQGTVGLSQTSTGFMSSFGKAFAYPLHGNGLISLVIGTVLLIVAQLALSWGGILALAFFLPFVMGYFCAYFFSIVKSSGLGKHEAPDWPEAGDWLSYSRHMVLYFLVVAWPLLVAASLSCFVSGYFWILFGILTPAVMFVMPMALLSSIMHNTVTVAADYKLTFSSIGRCIGHYMAYYVVMVVTTGLYFGAGFALTILGATLGFAVTVLLSLVIFAAQAYLFMFNGYLLGQIYFHNDKSIGWFR